MEPHDSPPAPTDHPVPRRVRRDGWTPTRQAEFLRHLSASHSVANAAKAVGMSRQSAYRLRAKLRGTPFDMAWEAAFRARFDALAEAAMDRAINGYEVPHWHQGEIVGSSRRYDERLTLALLAMRRDHSASNPRMSDERDYTDPDAFGRLVERVEDGNRDWLTAEEMRAIVDNGGQRENGGNA